eukprot:3368166-Rhodomonas_salina.5
MRIPWPGFDGWRRIEAWVTQPPSHVDWLARLPTVACAITMSATNGRFNGAIMMSATDACPLDAGDASRQDSIRSFTQTVVFNNL